MSKTCPKCGYTRDGTDRAPEYECPNCGVVYAKVEKSISNTNQATEDHTHKNCPYCGEQILSVAIKCKHCQSDLSNKKNAHDNNSNIECNKCKKTISTNASKCPHCGAINPEKAPSDQLSGCLGLILLSIIFVLFLGFCSSNNHSSGYKTNQELLEEYHRKGEFLGYEDGDKWARDMKRIKELKEKLKQ